MSIKNNKIKYSYIPGKHYTCGKEDRCKCNETISLYDHDDVTVYQRAKDEPLPNQCAMPSPSTRNCAMCTQIICPEDVVPKDGECTDGSQVQFMETTPVCMYQSPCTLVAGKIGVLGFCSLSFILIPLLLVLFSHFCPFAFFFFLKHV